MKISVGYAFLPKQMSLRTAAVMDHFGVGFETGRHEIAEELELPIQEGDVVCFTGESGSGKSSLMRAVAGELPGVVNIDALDLGEAILVEALGQSFEEAARLLSMCGLGEAHLMLRRPAELSDGQRYRFRLALALAQQPLWIMADEFTATLDRTLAKVVAFNLARHAGKTATGFLLATTHEDVLVDLQPTLHVRCALDGPPEVTRYERKKKSISFGADMWISRGTKSDWPHFARWHYRSHGVGLTRFVTVLWHGERAVGICLFTCPPISLRHRRRFFGMSGRWSRVKLQLLNRQLVNLSRVVLHPTYRGAGLAASFVRRSCELCPWPWIETLTQMGHVNPFFERAGFVRVGQSCPPARSRSGHSSLWGTRRHADGGKTLVSQQAFEKSRYAEPVYYVFDNRVNADG